MSSSNFQLERSIQEDDELRNIETLYEFMEWTKQLTNRQNWQSQYLFRGVTRKCYELEASALRRLLPKDRNIASLLDITRELIRDARDQGHGEKDGRRLHDLEILAELQHIGAATCLIDFSRSVLVALWIACQKSSKEPQEDGKVCAIRSHDSGGTREFKTISHDLVKEDISYFFKPNEIGKYPIYQWTPKLQNNRIIAQHSVFIFGRPTIDADFECVIKQENKHGILRDLKLLFNIDEGRMYPDLHGFAQLYAQDKCRSTPFPEDYLQHGFKAQERGDFDDAIRYYSNVIELNSTGSHFTFIAYSERGRIYGVQGKLDKAIEDYTKAIGIEPYSALNYNNRGVAYYKQGKPDKAIEDCTRAIELDPNNDLAYNNRGGAYYEQGKLDKAIEDFTRAIELDPNNDQAYYNRGGAYYKQGKLDKAIENYTKAIELNPDNADAYHNRGEAYYKQGKLDKAIEDNTKAIELNPDDDLAYENRGEAHQLQGNNDLAEADLRKVEALRSQS